MQGPIEERKKAELVPQLPRPSHTPLKTMRARRPCDDDDDLYWYTIL